MKIYENLYLCGSGSSGFYSSDDLDCNSYLLETEAGLVLIDTGLGRNPELIEKNIREDGCTPEQITYILITHGHADHAGGCSYFREKYKARVIAPVYEADYIQNGDEEMLGLRAARAAGYYPEDYRFKPVRADIKVSHGDLIRVGQYEFYFYEARGHSVGGVCCAAKRGAETLFFSGDQISYGGKISLQNIPGADIAAYARTVKQMEDAGADLFLPGHGMFCLKNGQRHIDQAVRIFEKLIIPVA